jgi:hypothetical protein
MLATDNFTMRISPQDKALLADVAKHLQRSQADTIKTLVREVYQVIRAEKMKIRRGKAHVTD